MTIIDTSSARKVAQETQADVRKAEDAASLIGASLPPIVGAARYCASTLLQICNEIDGAPPAIDATAIEEMARLKGALLAIERTAKAALGGKGAAFVEMAERGGDPPFSMMASADTGKIVYHDETKGAQPTPPVVSSTTYTAADGWKVETNVDVFHHAEHPGVDWIVTYVSDTSISVVNMADRSQGRSMQPQALRTYPWSRAGVAPKAPQSAPVASAASATAQGALPGIEAPTVPARRQEVRKPIAEWAPSERDVEPAAKSCGMTGAEALALVPEFKAAQGDATAVRPGAIFGKWLEKRSKGA